MVYDNNSSKGEITDVENAHVNLMFGVRGIIREVM